MPTTPTPLQSLHTSSYLIPAYDRLPNTSLQSKPLLIYHSCFPSTGTITSASDIESHLRSVGVVTPQWRYTMYRTTHYHSTTHEILSVYSGRATLCFGGERNPKRVEIDVRAGDVIIVPAGVAHRLLRDLDDDDDDDNNSNNNSNNGDGGAGFAMIGSYPSPGKDRDMCYGWADEEDHNEVLAERIRAGGGGIVRTGSRVWG